MLSLILLKQQAGVLSEQDVVELNRFMDPDRTVSRITTLRARTGT